MTLEKLREMALALEGASEAPHHHLTSFRVRGKIFATAHRKGTFANVFTDEVTRERALAIEPEVCEKLLWGGKVVGVRVLLAGADAGLVEELLVNAWEVRAGA